MKPPVCLSVRSQGIYLPPGKVSIVRLVSRGLLSAATARAQEYSSLTRAATPRAASEMAFRACRSALRGAGLSGGDVDLVVFSTALLKDRSYWSASADLCRRLNSRAEFLDIYQGCNGVLGSVDVVAAKFAGDPRLQTALVAASEYLPKAYAAHWRWDFGAFYGDGAGAWVLSRDPGRLSIRSTASRFLPQLSGFIWTSYGSYAELRAGERGVTPRQAKSRYLRRHRVQAVQRLICTESRACIAELLRDAGLRPNDIDVWVLQNFGGRLLRGLCAELEIPWDKVVWEPGRETGHVGNVDPILNLFYATKKTLPSARNTFGRAKGRPPRRNILIMTHGTGFSIMGMVLAEPSGSIGHGSRAGAN